MATSSMQAGRAARRSGLARFWGSTVGKKVVMAGTGLIMAGFLVTHATANLLVYLGPDYINEYSHFLHKVPEILWPARAVLLASVILHAVAAYQLTRVSKTARPVGYESRDPQVSTMASRTIRWGGVLIAVFIVYHILHFTIGSVHPQFVEGDPYGNLVTGFRGRNFEAVFYLVMMMVIGLHLYHGTWSALRTLGAARPSANPLRRQGVTVFAIAIWLGFSLVPIGIVLGIIGPR